MYQIFYKNLNSRLKTIQKHDKINFFCGKVLNLMLKPMLVIFLTRSKPCTYV